MKPKGVLYLLPGLLGEQGGKEWLCGYELQLIQELRLYFTENERTARRFLRKAGYEGDLNLIRMIRLDKRTGIQELYELLKEIEDGQDAGIVSEAGMPALADPGSNLLRMAHGKGIRVVPIPGPSAILLAVAASGLNGQQFCFHGYLPIEEKARVQRIKQLEEQIARNEYAHFFIETPYRNNQILSVLLRECKDSTLLSISVNLTEPDGWTKTKSIEQWRKQIPDLNKIPAVFGLG